VYEKEFSMPSHQPSTQSVYAVRQYLEREFPGQVRHTGWEQDVEAHVFEIAHERGHHQVLVSEGVLRSHRDIAAELRESELVDYLQEARAQKRRFLVRKEDGAVRIRSAALMGRITRVSISGRVLRIVTGSKAHSRKTLPYPNISEPSPRDDTPPPHAQA
jgi:hypothetical protein